MFWLALVAFILVRFLPPRCQPVSRPAYFLPSILFMHNKAPLKSAQHFSFFLSWFALVPQPLMLFESLQSACQVVDVFTQTGRENGENWAVLGKTEWEKQEAVQPVLLQGGGGGKEGGLGSRILDPES